MCSTTPNTPWTLASCEKCEPWSSSMLHIYVHIRTSHNTIHLPLVTHTYLKANLSMHCPGVSTHTHIHIYTYMYVHILHIIPYTSLLWPIRTLRQSCLCTAGLAAAALATPSATEWPVGRSGLVDCQWTKGQGEGEKAITTLKPNKQT